MKILTAVTGTPSTTDFSAPAQQTTILNADNVRYPRLLILSTDGIRVTHGSVSAGITVEDLIKAMVALEPTLTWPPVVTSQPNNAQVVLPSAPSFSFISNSEIAVTFQWFYSSNGGVTFSTCHGVSPFSGDQTEALLVGNAQGLHNYQFYCLSTNASGTTQTNIVTLFVDPDITTEPTNATVTAPAAHTFTVVGFTATTIAYQWQLSTTGGASWVNLTDTGVYTGSASPSLIISNSTGLNTNQYRVLLSNTNGASISTAAILTVL